MIKIPSEARIGKNIQSTLIPNQLAWPIKKKYPENQPSRRRNSKTNNTHISKLKENEKDSIFFYLKKETTKKGKEGDKVKMKE